jgi:hypothetical protein
MGRLELTAELQARGPAAAFVLSDEQVAEIGEGAKRFPVKATVNGYTWRTSVARMRGEFLLGLNREVRQGAHVEAGETATVVIELDTEPREIATPADLSAALAMSGDPELQKRFDGLAFTHRKEFVRWIEEAKKPETRERRIAQTLEMIGRGETRS